MPRLAPAIRIVLLAMFIRFSVVFVGGELELARTTNQVRVTSVAGLRVGSLITAAAHALAAGDPLGALIGNRDDVAERIVRHKDALGGLLGSLSFQLNASLMPHTRLMRAIEMTGEFVAPVLRSAVRTSVHSAQRLQEDCRYHECS